MAPLAERLRPRTLDDVVGQKHLLGPGKLLARCPNVPGTQFQRMVEQVVGDRAVVSYSGASGLAEISAKGVTKAAALADWCAGQGIDSVDVFAFGDMPNDLPMLTNAARTHQAKVRAFQKVRAKKK